MIRRRTTPDGLPFRVYCRVGKRITTWWYAHRDGTRTTLATAPTVNKEAVARGRQEAIKRGAELNGAPPAEGTLSGLIDAYFKWQEALPRDDERRKAASTLAENRREAARLRAVFGAMSPDGILAEHLYQYQDVRAEAGAGPKANKEIALLSAVLEYGRRRGFVQVNVARGIKRIPVRPLDRRVTWAELELVHQVALTLGPSAEVCALAAKAAWLTLRRPPEILGLTRPQVTETGLVFVAAKRKAGQAERRVTIEWSDELRSVVAAALAVKRQKVAGTWLPFGNLAGQRFTKSGWGTNWRRLLDAVKAEHPGFEHFALRDCRPGGVTEKQERGDRDTLDATAHADARMIAQVYDRRRTRKATPAR